MGAKDIPTLTTLAALLVGLMLVLHILGAFSTKLYNDQKMLLVTRYYEEFSKKTMKLDYEQIENPDVMDLRRMIQETENNHMAVWDMAEYLLKGFMAVITSYSIHYTKLYEPTNRMYGFPSAYVSRVFCNAEGSVCGR